MFIEWKEEYSVKISELDDQHKKLFAMVNQMHEAVRNGKGRDILDSIFHRLFEYIKTHFSAEEGFMEQYGYPDIQTHREKHKKMTQKVMSLYDDYVQGKTPLCSQVSNFLKDWLKLHILKTDKQYGDFLNSKGLH